MHAMETLGPGIILLMAVDSRGAEWAVAPPGILDPKNIDLHIAALLNYCKVHLYNYKQCKKP